MSFARHARPFGTSSALKRKKNRPPEYYSQWRIQTVTRSRAVLGVETEDYSENERGKPDSLF